MKLLVNADDFGFSKGINLGILEAFRNGVVTNTSLMVNMPGFEHAVELMKQYPELKVGLHLVTSVCKGITRGLSVYDEDGNFYHDQGKIASFDEEELYIEYKAQLDKFLSTGFTPTHIDWHWCYTPVQVRVAMRLAKENNLPVRAENKEIEQLFIENNIKTYKNHNSDFYNYTKEITTTTSLFIEQLQKGLDQGLEEMTLMCHPAYIDTTLLKLSSYNMQRAYELEVLTSNEVKDFIKNNDIELVSFDCL